MSERKHIPESMRKTYNARKRSKAMAIKAMCQECCGYSRKMVAECPDEGCPLWHHRPYQKTNPSAEKRPGSTPTEKGDE